MTRFGRLSSVVVAMFSFFALLTPTPSALAATQTITSSGPLTSIGISDQLNCSVHHAADAVGEFYGETACGTLVAVGGTLFGPADIPAGNNLAAPRTSFTPVSQSAVTGAGTSADPFMIVTVVDLGGTGLRITETDSYVVGEESYRTDVQVANTGASSQDAVLYRAGDCYLQSSDFGFGSVDPGTGAVACTAGAAPGSRIEQWFPISVGSHYFEAGFAEIWARIGAQQAFPDTCRCAELIDNGAGLSWGITVPASGSVTRSHLTTFSPLGRRPLSTAKTADNPSVGAGSADGYTITVSNPNSGPVTLSSITDTLPTGFTYTAGSTTGATTSDPAISGQTLTWAGPFTVPGGSVATPGTVSVHFAVTVSSTPGNYFNNAGATSPDFTVAPTGDTAKITVGSAPGGKLEVRKVLSPPADPGRFNLQIDGVTQKPDAGNGDTTGKQSVTVGSHTVGETAGTATALGNYTSAISCKDQGGMGATIASSADAGPLSVNLASGADVVCTITNTRKVSASDCEIEGKGEITAANGDEANFSLDVAAGPPPTGRLRYRDKGPQGELRLTSTAVTDVLVAGSGTEATISGTARTRAGVSLNYRVDVRDLASSDTFRIRLSNGYDSGTQQVQDGKVDIECGDDDEEDEHGEEGEHSEEATTARQANTAREGRHGE